MSSQQGDSIPGICHAFTIVSPKYKETKSNELKVEKLSKPVKSTINKKKTKEKKSSKIAIDEINKNFKKSNSLNINKEK